MELRGGPSLWTGAPAGKPGHCKCKKSRCLKLYCDCFAKDEECGDLCTCANCHNNAEHELARATARAALETRTSGKAMMFQGCHCKKSKCLKKYCECFNRNEACTDSCRCVQCHNTAGPQRIEENEDELMLKKPRHRGSIISIFATATSAPIQHLPHLSGLPANISTAASAPVPDPSAFSFRANGRRRKGHPIQGV